MNQPMPAYVTRFELSGSVASENFTARGSIITGPNEGQYIATKGKTKELAIENFRETAKSVYENARRRG